jgi:hypothetical protein
MGTVENLYVEEDSKDMRFVDVVTNGFLAWEGNTTLFSWKP